MARHLGQKLWQIDPRLQRPVEHRGVLSRRPRQQGVRDVRRLDRLPITPHCRAAERVLQFADVAGPSLAHQKLLGVLRELPGRKARLRRALPIDPIKQGFDEGGEIALARAQRWHA